MLCGGYWLLAKKMVKFQNSGYAYIVLFNKIFILIQKVFFALSRRVDGRFCWLLKFIPL